jgi:hypothetical protein
VSFRKVFLIANEAIPALASPIEVCLFLGGAALSAARCFQPPAGGEDLEGLVLGLAIPPKNPYFQGIITNP